MSIKKLDEVYIFHLEKAYKQFKKYKTNYLKKAGIDLTSDQWVLMKRISEEEGINQRELAKGVFKEPASVTRILDILERKGWVERKSSLGDRRTYQLFLTVEGKVLVDRMLPIAREIRAKGMNGFSEKEQEAFSAMLIRLFENFG